MAGRHKRARRRYHRRHHHYGRENPLSDTTKIAIAVGVTAAVVGVGYLLYRRSQGSSTGLLQPTPPPMLPPPTQGQGGVQTQPPVTSPQGQSTPNSGSVVAASQVMATRAITPTAAPRPKAAHLDWSPAVTSPTFDPNNPNP